MTTDLKSHTPSASRTPMDGSKASIPERPRTHVQATLFRPRKRPPVAKVQLMDDDLMGSEWVRLRADRTLFGRDCQAVSIPHDSEISQRHAQIRRVRRHGVYQWVLEDLNSRNGTFVRVRRCRLKQGRKFLLGSRIFSVMFSDEGNRDKGTELPNEAAAGGTSLFTPALPGYEKTNHVTLVECTRDRRPLEIKIPAQECWLGSDSQSCQCVIEDDPWLDGRHARLFRDAQNRWVIEDAASVNGLWVGIHAFRLRDRTWIQMGEQRLLFRLPSVVPSPSGG